MPNSIADNPGKLEPMFGVNGSTSGTTNRTDPIVRHDPTNQSGLIITKYEPQTRYDMGTVQNKAEERDMMDGVFYPLIRMNSHLIMPEQIISFSLHNDRFMPYMELAVDDFDDIIEFTDSPGINNVIVVMLFEYKADVHRPIKLDFYITDIKRTNDIYFIQAEYKNIELEKIRCQQERFTLPSNGCQAQWCKLKQNTYPNTYEFLHEVAHKCGLGFQATQKTRSIRDDKARILSSKKYRDAIQEHVATGGLDDMSYFDAWIDPWQMLTLVNVPWVMNEYVTPNQLAVTAITGLPVTQYGSESSRVAIECHRTITNTFTLTGINNLMCSRIERIADLNTGYHDGIVTKYDIFSMAGQKKGDSCFYDSPITDQIIEMSPSGAQNKDSYAFEKRRFIGFDNNLKTPCMWQKWKRREYFKQLRLVRYKAYMPYVNFGIQRGMLVTVAMFTRSTLQKATIRHQASGLQGNTETEMSRDAIMDSFRDPDTGKTDMTAEETQQTAVLDTATAGIYYVDGVEWEYDDKRKNMQQILYLIKKGPVTQYVDGTSGIKLNKDVKM